MKHDYYGDHFQWFVGVVEDNKNDPMRLGRVRVRCFGIHSPYLNQVEIDDLPWAGVLIPGTEGGISGMGRSPTGIQQGAWVIGFFMDEEQQNPMILGSFPRVELKGEGINPLPIEPGAVHADAQAPQLPRGVSNAEKMTMAAVDRGFSPETAAAITGALAVESNLNLNPLTELLKGQQP